MDILHLVDRLEESVKKSRRFPFSPVRLLDERKILSLIDQMRISVPEEVRRAQRVNQQRERILAQAREDAEQLMREAHMRTEELTAEHPIAQAAESHATTVREKAEREATTLRAEADQYAFNALCQLEEELRRLLHVVENGLRRIQAEQAAAQEESARRHSPESATTEGQP